jgi:hypothetical protein
MKFIANKIHWLGLFLLIGFAAAAAGLYFDVPSSPEKKPQTTASEAFTCPMHPEIVAAKAGDCSKCGMALKSTSALSVQSDAHAGCGAETTAGEAHGCCGEKAQETTLTLPPGHPPVAGYTVQAADAHAGCNHGAENAAAAASAK